MKKYVVISSTDNDDYLFYIPMVIWAWNKFGWGVLVIGYCKSNTKTILVQDSLSKIENNSDFSFIPPNIENYKVETLAQCSRMYISNAFSDDVFVMVSDCDIIPLSDYWEPEFNDITCYGRNLSNEHQPMCYVAASVLNWKSIMNLSGNSTIDMKRDLGNEKEIKWTTDQDILTFKLWGKNIKNIDRPISTKTNYPVGRIDRSSWQKSLEQPERIDAHLFREGYKEENWVRIISLIKECFNPSNEEINWMQNYRTEYLKLL